jgi:hypothetical protein
MDGIGLRGALGEESLVEPVLDWSGCGLACMIAAQIQPLPVVCRLAPGVDIPAALAWAVLRLDPSPPAPPASDNLISLLEGAFSFAIFTLLLLLSCVLPHGVLQVDRRFSPTFFKRSLAVLPSPNDRSVNVRERWDPPFRKVKSIHRHTTANGCGCPCVLRAKEYPPHNCQLNFRASHPVKFPVCARSE